MKKILTFILILSSIRICAQSVTELRGVWITNVDSYVLSYDPDIAKAMDYLATIGVNVIFPVMWNSGYTLYPSQIMQNRFGKPIQPSMSGRDPLARLVLEAHRNGIEVIPWMEYGFATSYVSGGNVSGDFILNKYPAWASKTNSGGYVIDGDGSTGFVWTSGINPDVQDFIISLATEMIDNYDIDGIQGDDRLPALPVEGGYDSVTTAIYKSENNNVSPPGNYMDYNWKRWRANKLNQFFQRFRDSIKTRSSNLILSSAPSPYYWGYDDHLQDSKTWVNNGIVDNFIPQIYPNPPSRSFSEFQYILQRTLQDIAPEKKSITFAGVLAKVGSYVIPKSQIVDCVKENRRLNLKGETFFFYEGIANANKANGDTLKSSVYAQPAILPYRNGQVWRPKASIVNEDDSMSITKTGSWQIARNSALGFRPNIIYSNDTAYTSIKYKLEVPADAWYGVYVWIEPNFNYTAGARYAVYSGNDSLVFSVNQTLSKNKGWFKLGDFFLLKGNQNVVKLDNIGLETGKYLMADAAMIMINRKLSPDVVISSVKKDNKSVVELSEIAVLNSNYPNPFNPSTIINYTLLKDCKVDLKVYDILGREAANLFSGNQKAGSHSFNFNIGQNSSGVYFYQLKAGNTTLTGKMTAIK